MQPLHEQRIKNASSWSVTSLSFNGGSPRILEVETKKALKRDPFLLSKKWIVFPMIIMFQGARFCCEFVWQVEGFYLWETLCLPKDSDLFPSCMPCAGHVPIFSTGLGWAVQAVQENTVGPNRIMVVGLSSKSRFHERFCNLIPCIIQITMVSFTAHIARAQNECTPNSLLNISSSKPNMSHRE